MKTVNAVVSVVLEVWVTVALTRRTSRIEQQVSRTTIIVLISAKYVRPRLLLRFIEVPCLVGI
jgi:hypothetical protein